ncbi:MAG: DUF58 domain-containing protein [Phycisphaerales bacterium]|nr:DUF58 domain-containing protein [Phycisphaerales bacterium]
MLVSRQAPNPRTMDDLLPAELVARLERLDVHTRKMFPGKMQGERRSKRRGRGVEFHDFRGYVRGDDIRFIDWNIVARFGKLFVRLFVEEEDLALHIVVDASSSMDTGDPNKLLFASRVAMSLGYIGLVRQNRVGMTVFGRPGVENPRIHPDARGRHRVRSLADFMLREIWEDETHGTEGGASGKGGDFNSALSLIARSGIGKGVVVVLSDFLIEGGYERGLRDLSAAGGGGAHDVYCLQVLSPSELEPERELERGVSGDLRMTDIESGHASEITITAPLVKRYKERVANYCADLESFCAARGMTHMLVRSDADISRLIMETLRQRGMLA